MPQTESSALIRFINSAAQEPIFETESAFVEPSAFQTTPEILTDTFSRPARGSTVKWIATGILLLGAGIGLAVLLMKFGGPSNSSASAAAPAKQTPPAMAVAAAPAPAAPVVAPAPAAPVVAPAPVAAAPAPAPVAAAAAPVVAPAAPVAAALPTPAPTPAAAPAIETTPIVVPSVTGQFLTQPPGAKVTLVEAGQVRESLKAPAAMTLQAGHTYQVLFEKAGYQTVARAVTPKAGATLRLVVMLERVAAADEPAPSTRRAKARRSIRKTKKTRRARRAVKKPRIATRAPAGAKGVLMIGARPPCEIYINGRRTGLTTPQRSIKLRPGRYRITLVNREHRIKSTSRVTVKSGKKVRLIRNLTKQMRH